MLDKIMTSIPEQLSAYQYLLTVINIMLHIVFAGAVAKDSGQLTKSGEKTLLVSGITWSFATLVGGVITAAIYWVIHHSKITRN